MIKITATNTVTKIEKLLKPEVAQKYPEFAEHFNKQQLYSIKDVYVIQVIDNKWKYGERHFIGVTTDGNILSSLEDISDLPTFLDFLLDKVY